jgi:hypothetical protein
MQNVQSQKEDDKECVLTVKERDEMGKNIELYFFRVMAPFSQIVPDATEPMLARRPWLHMDQVLPSEPHTMAPLFAQACVPSAVPVLTTLGAVLEARKSVFVACTALLVDALEVDDVVLVLVLVFVLELECGTWVVDVVVLDLLDELEPDEPGDPDDDPLLDDEDPPLPRKSAEPEHVYPVPSTLP